MSSETMDSSLIHLQWGEHCKHFTSGCQQMFVNGQLLDVEIKCGSNSIKAHKVVLASYSSFFESLIVNNNTKKQLILIYGVPFEDLTAIIQFMYFGEVTVPHTQLTSLLNTAKELQIKILKDLTIRSTAEIEPTAVDQILMAKNGAPLETQPEVSSVNGVDSSDAYSGDSNSTTPSMIDYFDNDSQNAIKHQQKITNENMEEARTDPMTSAIESSDNSWELIEKDIFDDSGSVRDSSVPMQPDVREEEEEEELLTDFDRAISHFVVSTDESETSVISKYFGKLMFVDPKSAKMTHLDEDQHYCSLCLTVHQENPLKTFVECDICCFEKQTDSELFLQHLSTAHHLAVNCSPNL